MTDAAPNRLQIHFVTGKLAEPAVRDMLARLGPEVGFDYTIEVLGITVAALMTTTWIAPRVHVPSGTSKVLLPGYVRGELQPLAEQWGVPVELGPKDIRQLPEHFGKRGRRPPEYGRYDIEILAEINHAPRLTLPQILARAEQYRADGANLIDVGCDPGEPWSGAFDTVRALRDAGHRVSIDSLNPIEIAAAAKAGAELVLSVNQSNRAAAADWGLEVVAIPDDPATLAGLDETIEVLAAANVRLRIDPILEPIGFGCGASLLRYWQTRQKYPDAEIMMGIGNLTELTDVDSAGLNVLLLALCQEWGIRSVLTTEVINWARSSVRECDLARRLVLHAVQQKALPKRLEPELVLLRDPQLFAHGPEQLQQLADRIKDHNFRLFAEGGELHAMNGHGWWQATDPFVLFEQMLAAGGHEIDARHAFYLGYELHKALTALTLGKQYQQDQPLRWGFLTRPEESHQERKRKEREV